LSEREQDALNSEHREHPYRGVFGRSHVRVTVNAANITKMFAVFAMFGSYYGNEPAMHC
jgi:hypothetical protein